MGHTRVQMAPPLAVSDAWDPIPPQEIAELLSGAPFVWCLAGGYAVERFVGVAYREHGDTDILVLRRDHPAVHTHLGDWEWFAADPPGTLRPWLAGEILPAGVHDVWGHRRGRHRWELQLMIQDSDETSWIYRRDDRIRGNLDDLARSIDGIPCIRMDLQLLYKSKGLRPKDRLDFDRLLSKLHDDERAALAEWLRIANPQGHEWLSRLESRPC